MKRRFFFYWFVAVGVAGCTVKAVGDPNRPITINANVVVDIRGLKKTAVGIEDMVAAGSSAGLQPNPTQSSPPLEARAQGAKP